MIYFMPPMEDNPDGKDGKRMLWLYIIVSFITIVPAFLFTKTQMFGSHDDQFSQSFINIICGITFWAFQAIAFFMLLLFLIDKYLI